MLQENFRQFQVQEDALSKQEQDILALQRETDALVQESGQFPACKWVSCIYLPFWNCRNFDDDFLSLFIERGVQKSKGVKETLDQDYSQRRRSAATTSYEMINDYNLSTRYRRREETKNILEFIHRDLKLRCMGHGIFWLPMQVMKP